MVTPQTPSSKAGKSGFCDPDFPALDLLLTTIHNSSDLPRYPLSQHTNNPDQHTVIPFGNLDPGSLGGGMYNLAVADIHSHVIDPGALSIKQQIPWLHDICTDGSTLAGLGS